MNDVDIGSVLPHRSPALLLTRVVRTDGTFLDGQGCIPPAHPLAENGRAPVVLGVELGAQAAGALEVLRRDAGERLEGYLVAIRRARFHVLDLPVDEPLAVTATRTGGAGPLAIADIRVSDPDGGALLVEASVTTWKQGA